MRDVGTLSETFLLPDHVSTVTAVASHRRLRRGELTQSCGHPRSVYYNPNSSPERSHDAPTEDNEWVGVADNNFRGLVNTADH
jgi:hypothetical protein